MVRNAIRSCGMLWQNLTDLSDYPILLDNVIDALNTPAMGGDLTLKEILEIDVHIKPLLVSFVDNGIMDFDKETTKVSVKKETREILKIIIDILRISGKRIFGWSLLRENLHMKVCLPT